MSLSGASRRAPRNRPTALRRATLALTAGVACLAAAPRRDSPAPAPTPTPAASPSTQPGMTLPHVIMEGYPEGMAEALRRHEKQLQDAAKKKALVQPFAFIIASTQRWNPGATIDVAFRGGTPALYAQIEEVAQAWTAPGAANLKLRFRDAQGAYKQWSPNDPTYTAEIRISFDGSGYWSSIGKGSTDATLPGGKRSEASMNLEGFDKALPHNWKGIIRHEFGHALGFMHEHQSPKGGCDFRYLNDPGYLYQKDDEGWYRVDDNGKRPGLYTYLGGYSNHWSKKRVDENMKPLASSSAYEIGTFDKVSIMKYFFYSFQFAAGEDSPCYTLNDAENLSPGDLAGARRAYPAGLAAGNEVILKKIELLEELRDTSGISTTLKQSLTNRLVPLAK